LKDKDEKEFSLSAEMIISSCYTLDDYVFNRFRRNVVINYQKILKHSRASFTLNMDRNG
jgi:hypothetical protein